MDLRKVKSLIDLVSESDISELEISEGPDKVKIVKSSKAIYETHIGKSGDPYVVDRQTDEDKKDVMPREDGHADDGSSTILSPMVGTFYRHHPLTPSLLCPLGMKSKKVKLFVS